MIEALPRWPGETVAIIGGGPSLKVDQVRYLEHRPVRVIGVNRAYRLAPWADVLHAHDQDFWRDHPDALEARSVKTTCDEPVDERVVRLPASNKRPFTDPVKPIHAADSGYEAIQLAALLEAARVILLGFDATYFGRFGKNNWHEGYANVARQKPRNYAIHLYLHVALAGLLRERGCMVINCTPDSAIAAYPMAKLEEALP